MELVAQNKAKFDVLRGKYPDFSYLDYSWVRQGSTLVMSFTYALSLADIVTTTLSIRLPEEVTDEAVRAHEDYIFRIGLIEALSYWKAYCSPKIRILCGSLSESEIAWWRDTWYDGMGEFRYRNGLLDVSKDSWVEFVAGSKISEKSVHDFSKLSGNLIAFTGGKDSTLALGLLRDEGGNTNETFFVQALAPARDAIKEVLGVSSYPETIVERHMHERLLALNAEGALNGHTPFSIVVAFLGMLTASLRGKKYFIVANESSADESTVAGTDINHQYSKSLIFEKRFQSFCKSLWPNGPQYFSLLRPFSEIGIVTLLKKYEDTMLFVSSCNVKNKKGQWCGSCPKCLFAFMLFSAEWNIAFAERMFGTNMFTKGEYLGMLEELTGLAPTKPFECVGTTKESLAILSLILSKQSEAKNMPLLIVFLERHADILPSPEMYKMIACEFHEHAIADESFVVRIKQAQDEVCHE